MVFRILCILNQGDGAAVATPLSLARVCRVWSFLGLIPTTVLYFFQLNAWLSLTKLSHSYEEIVLAREIPRLNSCSIGRPAKPYILVTSPTVSQHRHFPRASYSRLIFSLSNNIIAMLYYESAWCPWIYWIWRLAEEKRIVENTET